MRADLGSRWRGPVGGSGTALERDRTTMHAEVRAIEVKLPEAELLADLYGILLDLAAATSLCDRAIELGRPERPDYLLIEGLAAAAVVRYFRCFSTGARLGLRREDITELGDQDLLSHDYFKALRDKFVAHSVNPFEATYVTASARVEDGTMCPIHSLHPGQHRLVLSTDTAEALAYLISKVRAVVQKRVSLEEHRLLAVVQALPLETIHSGDLHTPSRVDPRDVDKSRKQTLRSNHALKRTPRKRGAA